MGLNSGEYGGKNRTITPYIAAANEIIYADIHTIVEEVKALNGKAVVKFTSDIKLLGVIKSR